MKIELSPPQSIFGPGERDNMEDYILPKHGKATAQDKLFIVCDGMGGHARGETASRLACEGFSSFFTDHPVDHITENYLQHAFDHVEGLFDEYITENPASRGMGTTVALACADESSIAVLHCGDSRLYHFRGDKLLWKTRDHKLVEELIAQGVMSEKEAARSGKSNIITRAIQGYSVLDCKPDIHFLTDIKPDDYILICSDGVYESLTTDDLILILSSPGDDIQKVNTMEDVCRGCSKDNYSAFLFKIKDVK